MWRYLLLAAAVLAFSSCGGSKGPTAPTILAALLQASGTLQYESCTWISSTAGWECWFTGEAKTNGAGCAIRVRGITRIIKREDNQQFSVGEWSLDSRITIRPNESFLYKGYSIRVPPTNTDYFYRTEISWDNVGC